MKKVGYIQYRLPVNMTNATIALQVTSLTPKLSPITCNYGFTTGDVLSALDV